MGLRQPSSTAAFFAQSTAGAQQQKEARKKLKKPQAIGGSASAGTAMVQAGTQEQQKATEQVTQTTQDAQKNINVNPENVQSSTAMAIAGKGTGTSGQYSYIVGPDGKRVHYENFQGGISGPQTFSQVDPDALSRSSDMNYIDKVNTDTQSQLSKVQADLKLINDQIANATAEDAKKLQAEKERLEKLFTEYSDKLTKENLGQISGPSSFEQDLLTREEILAQEGDNVSKLSALFGKPRKFGALESQIYGKDLEGIQEAAKVGLIERKEAEGAADIAQERYKNQLGESQTKVAESLKKEQDKSDILKKTPEELRGTTREDLVKLFGNLGLVQSLFEFDDSGKVVGTKASSIRNAYTREESKLKDILTKVPGAKENAQRKQDEKIAKEFKDADTEVTTQMTTAKNTMNYVTGAISRYRNQINDEQRSFFGGYSGISRDSSTLDIMEQKSLEFNKNYKILQDAITSAQQSKKTKDLQEYKRQIEQLNTTYRNEMKILNAELSGNIRQYLY